MISKLFKYRGKNFCPAVCIAKENSIIGTDMIALAETMLHKNGGRGQNTGQAQQFPCCRAGFNKACPVRNIGNDVKHTGCQAALFQAGRKRSLLAGCQRRGRNYFNSNVVFFRLHAGLGYYV